MNAQTSVDAKAVAAEALAVAHKPAGRLRRWRKPALMLAVPVALALAAAGWWVSGGGSVSTENANLHQPRISIASTVGGRVVSVHVQELQVVSKGDLLFQIDPEPFDLAVTQAEAAVAAARLQVAQLHAAYVQAEAQASLAAEDDRFQAEELARQQELSGKGVASTSTLDEFVHASNQAQHRADVARLATDAARAALGGDPDAEIDAHPAVRAALADLDRARYNLATSFREGVMIAAGQPVFALVETGEAWVDANFKETQLADLATGQSVEIVFDAAPGLTFSGKVEAIGAGTGAEFSLLPAQNATGNWVKVTQRVPVRIRLDDPAAAARLASGLSAEVTVDISEPSAPQLPPAG
jgi:membrane fusion protein (multidrug efflux system)